MVLVAAGTFFAQAVTTSFVSRAAKDNKPAASGIYLASYFLGGMIGSAVLGGLYQSFGWSACVAGIAVALGVAAILARRLHLPLT
jgi:predicted MFS family arabinose efflux permease